MAGPAQAGDAKVLRNIPKAKEKNELRETLRRMDILRCSQKANTRFFKWRAWKVYTGRGAQSGILRKRARKGLHLGA
jgi:hypothetical protein